MPKAQFGEEPTDPQALENLDLAKKVYDTEVRIDITNQTIWVRSGHLLKNGAIFPTKPKVRYFKNNQKQKESNQ